MAAVVVAQLSVGFGLSEAWGATSRVVVKVVTPSVPRGGTLEITLKPGVDRCTLSVPHLTPLAHTKVVVARKSKASLVVPTSTTLGKHAAVVICRQGVARTTFAVVKPSELGTGGAVVKVTPSPSRSFTTTPAPTSSAPPATSAAPTTAPATSASPSPETTWDETTFGEAHTWTNYSNAGGDEGATIPGFGTVQISCRLKGFIVSDGNAWWYRIATAPWSDQFYVSADAFYNVPGMTTGSPAGTPLVDEAVALC